MCCLDVDKSTHIFQCAVATLRVVRTGGLFDRVTVPFEVTANGPDGATLSDLSLNRGALLFNQGEEFRVCVWGCVWVGVGVGIAVQGPALQNLRTSQMHTFIDHRNPLVTGASVMQCSMGISLARLNA
jgi:hypothetical protein